jgi:hypothetical protein
MMRSAFAFLPVVVLLQVLWDSDASLTGFVARSRSV